MKRERTVRLTINRPEDLNALVSELQDLRDQGYLRVAFGVSLGDPHDPREHDVYWLEVSD